MQVDLSDVVHSLDALLEELERGEENGVDCAGPSHAHAEPAVHVLLEELDLDPGYFLSFRVHQRISLVYALGRIDRV